MSGTPTFRLLTGCRLSLMRGVGFLEGHKDLDAGIKFDRFGASIERNFRSRMDQWLDGANGPDSYFHNFKSDTEHRDCFAFKYREHRLYGFLCNPKNDDSRFQLCALCLYATKFEHESDRTELDRVQQWRNDFGAGQAIRKIYPPATKRNSNKGRQSWKN